MLVVSRKPDETVLIGSKLSVTLTDVDASGVRLHARGELMGGADDGLQIDRAYELGMGGEVSLGSAVRVVIVRLASNDQRAYLGFMVPPPVTVHRKEIAEALERKKREEE